MPSALRCRSILLALTAVSQLAGVVGLPRAGPPRAAKHTAVDFPCRTRPCGCADSNECWAGDCCCFTLEEKVAWADARGVEPPPHVRPLVAARTAKAKPAAKKSCCAAESPGCCEAKPEPARTVRWVAGVFAAKCRGDGPAGLLAKTPAVAPDLTPAVAPASPGRDRHPFPASAHAEPTPHRPPTPPPRHA